MNIEIFEMLTGILVSVLTALVGVMWRKADAAEKHAEANKAEIAHLSRNLDKTNELTERLSSLEASFNAEIKNLSVSIKRMESALLRMDMSARNLPK